MDLSAAEELIVLPLTHDRVRVEWRVGEVWDAFEYVDEDSLYADDEDILWWLLRQKVDVELVKASLAVAYPDFDVDEVLGFVTMPDRAAWRAKDRAHRERLKAEFRARRRR